MPERKQFESALRELEENILRLASMVDENLDKAMRALETEDESLAREVTATDQVINELRYETEDAAVLFLATQAPAATDLRFVVASIIIAEELERMGDHAAGIASLLPRLPEAESFDRLHKLPKMARRARKMMSRAVQSFVERDVDLAYDVIVMDDKLDKQYRQLFYKTMGEMKDPDYVRPATFLMWIGHDLERIGDRATNIAERTIFLLTSKHIEIMPSRDTSNDDMEDDDDEDDVATTPVNGQPQTEETPTPAEE